MHIGLIGGIGVAATDHYYRALVAEMHRRDVDLDLTIVHADAPTLLANFRANNQSEQAAIYAGLTERLAKAGAERVAVTSIGGHFCIDAFHEVSPLPVVDLRRAIAAKLAERGITSVGLLGTNTVMRTGLYGHLTALRTLIPADDVFDEVHQAYVDMALAAEVTEEQRALFFAAGREMTARGAETVLLAGTDLFLAFDGRDCGFSVLDGALLHVDVLADLAAS